MFEKVVEWVKILTLERYCVFESVVFSVLYGTIGIRNATTDKSCAKNGGIFDPDGTVRDAKNDAFDLLLEFE